MIFQVKWRVDEVSMRDSTHVRPCSQGDFDAVVVLGDRFKKYLGLYPHKAIREAITNGFVFGAFLGDKLTGYALFALPYSDIRLVHLCVDPAFYAQGIARALIDAIQATYSDRQGIRLKCRRDFPAHKVWPKLGFQAESLPSGRGADRAEMTAWRKPFGPADLFASMLEDETRVQAVLDTNVVLDVLLERNDKTAKFLHSPSIYDEVALCITRSVKNELSELSPMAARRRVLSRLAQFDELPSEGGTCRALKNELLKSVPVKELRNDSSLEADAGVLAETIVSGAAVLITNDDTAGRVLRKIANSYGVEILHPSQLVVMIDELKGQRKDASGRLQNTGVTVTSSSAGIDREMDHLISTYRGESKAKFRDHLRGSMAANMRIIHAAESNLVDGLVATASVGNELQVSLLRVRRAPIAPTLLKQLLFQLRLEALENGAARILITDPAPGGGENIVPILRQEGARLKNGRWRIEVVDAQLRLNEFLSGRVGSWDLRDWLQNEPQSPMQFATLERELWPLKIKEAPLSNYVIPIRQTFASELLGYDSPLLTRDRDLGISRRHIYYKSAPYKPAAPGRILWYVSGKRGGSIVAASQLISSHNGVPQDLHARFRKYGVWSQQDIADCADKKGRAVAIRFGDTEIFRSEVSLTWADRVAQEYGNILGTVPTARVITDAAFQVIYDKGMNS
ncbi:GNAT family N-acetyltransferase [Specibacter sp. NPDC057265]|uniref:GNAT family N-acetyltransferase n=1 Tax=Specibacter sp. NPDC057265 TaxID=3346075 RepID=UPI003641D323